MQTELTQPAALISVYYKDGIDRLARALHNKGYVIYSTGNTASYLRKLGLPIIEVSDFTAFPEMMDGRLKTLHPKVFGSILGRMNNIKDLRSMQEQGMVMMNVVVVNLYPFQQTVTSGATYNEIIEKIDIGGPSLIRAAGKNHDRVSVICDPQDYDILAAMIESGVEIPLLQRKRWFKKVFDVMVVYETSVQTFIGRHLLEEEAAHV